MFFRERFRKRYMCPSGEITASDACVHQAESLRVTHISATRKTLHHIDERVTKQIHERSWTRQATFPLSKMSAPVCPVKHSDLRIMRTIRPSGPGHMTDHSNDGCDGFSPRFPLRNRCVTPIPPFSLSATLMRRRLSQIRKRKRNKRKSRSRRCFIVQHSVLYTNAFVISRYSVTKHRLTICRGIR